jgi:hypothetical protein
MSIDPKIISRLKREEAYLNSLRTERRRVKLEVGQSWLVRFLPAKFGPDGIWYARIANHWLLRKVPIVCPRNTAEDFGGDPDFACPVCQLLSDLADHRDQALKDLAYRTKATPQYMVYCAVFSKNGVEQPLEELLKPYEMWLYRSSWEELKAFYLAGTSKSPDSIMDYQLGNDFAVHRTSKGLRLDKQDTSPILDRDSEDYNYEECIRKLEAAMVPPKVSIPTHEQLVAFCQKIMDSISNAEDFEGGSSSGFSEEESVPVKPVRRTPVAATPVSNPPVAKRKLVSATAGENPTPVSRRPAARENPATPVISEVEDTEDNDEIPLQIEDDEETPTLPVAGSKIRALEPTARRAQSSADARIAQSNSNSEDDLPVGDFDPVKPADELPAEEAPEVEEQEKPKTNTADIAASIRERLAKLKQR